jgi:hypothetical protein
MERLDRLVGAIQDEDRRLRDLLQQIPPDRREKAGPGGTLSVKETLGHLAFWDSFAVLFFESKLRGDGIVEGGAIDFEQRNRQEIKRLRALPWHDVLEMYCEATLHLAQFLRVHWSDLTDQERRDFATPLRHRRHHRLLLERALPPGHPRARAEQARSA